MTQEERSDLEARRAEQKYLARVVGFVLLYVLLCDVAFYSGWAAAVWWLR